MQKNFKTKIFLDSGDPEETKRALDLIGFLDGQTTNPSLVAKKIGTGKTCSKPELLLEYRKIVEEIYQVIPNGSISVEVYADLNTSSDEMISQAREMYKWIPNAHIKLPTNFEGLKALQVLSGEGMRINMTLVFTQEQAAAVYAASLGADNIYVSPFLGRVQDQGDDDLVLIDNIQKMYSKGDNHVQILAASIRDTAHLTYVINKNIDIVTVPLDVLENWVKEGSPIENIEPHANTNYKHLEYLNLNLKADWKTFNIESELTRNGIIKFSDDWNKVADCTTL